MINWKTSFSGRNSMILVFNGHVMFQCPRQAIDSGQHLGEIEMIDLVSASNWLESLWNLPRISQSPIRLLKEVWQLHRLSYKQQKLKGFFMLMASGISGFLANNKYAGTTSLLRRDFLGPKWCQPSSSSPIFGLNPPPKKKSIEPTSKQTLPTYQWSMEEFWRCISYLQIGGFSS